jgi:hypothetical protein
MLTPRLGEAGALRNEKLYGFGLVRLAVAYCRGRLRAAADALGTFTDTGLVSRPVFGSSK